MITRERWLAAATATARNATTARIFSVAIRIDGMNLLDGVANLRCNIVIFMLTVPMVYFYPNKIEEKNYGKKREGEREEKHI